MSKSKGKRQHEALLLQRFDSSERTRVKLHQALDRFEHGQLVVLESGSKLTVRNLAVEAGVSKDTPLSRFRAGQPKAGEYRFPDIVARFSKLKTRRVTKASPSDLKEAKIQELRKIVGEQEEKLVVMARVNNQLDAEVVDLRRRCSELEEQNARLRQEAIVVLPSVQQRAGQKADGSRTKGAKSTRRG